MDFIFGCIVFFGVSMIFGWLVRLATGDDLRLVSKKTETDRIKVISDLLDKAKRNPEEIKKRSHKSPIS
jgi:hypothetical protein